MFLDKGKNNAKKLCKLFCGYQNLSYLCTRKRLGYGVMVTLQILVLPFLVRVRVAQQKKKSMKIDFFFCGNMLFVNFDVFLNGSQRLGHCSKGKGKNPVLGLCHYLSVAKSARCMSKTRAEWAGMLVFV